MVAIVAASIVVAVVAVHLPPIVVAIVGVTPLPATPLPDLGRRQEEAGGVGKEEGREVGAEAVGWVGEGKISQRARDFK